MSKRGQFSLLVILGLLLVAVVMGVYIFRDKIFLSSWDREKAAALVVPDQAQEMHDTVSSCVQTLAEQGVTLMGRQGGYITIPEDPIGQGDYNQFSNALEIFPGKDFRTPYWFYIAANNVPHSQVPSLETMQNELATYVSDNLASCANDYALFASDNATSGSISTDVEIQNERVLITVHYPITLALDDFTFTFPAFYQEVDVPLGSMYSSAVSVMDAENKNYPLEDLTYDSMVLDENVPLSWTEFNCERRRWRLSDVETALKKDVYENIGAVKAKGTKYSVTRSSQKGYFEWKLLSSNAGDLRVNFLSSQNWPFYMKVSPTQGSTLVEDTLTGSPATSFLSGLFCLTRYSFVYDIKYPVLINLYDDKSDYTFQFATMVVLDNNQARENREGTLDLAGTDSTICGNAISPLTVDIMQVAADGSLTPLSDAEVSFQCINNKCPLGSSGSGSLTTKVPQCVNGQVIAEKDGYAKGQEVITTLGDQEVTVVLEKYADLRYDLQVVDASGNTRAPTSGETLYVTLTNKDTDYSTSVSYPAQSESVLLSPGTYTVTGQMISDVDFTVNVDPSSYTKCVTNPEVGIGGLFGFTSDQSCTDITLNAVQLQSALTGGVSQSWHVGRDALSSASRVTFYVTSPGTPSSASDVGDVYNYIDSGLGGKEPVLS